jgi:hypothetical protein
VIQPLFEHRLTLAGFDTRVLELEGNGPPVILLHGYADSADTWRQSLARLARSGQRAVAFDLPGFRTASRLRRDPILPQLDEFAFATVRYAADRTGWCSIAAREGSRGRAGLPSRAARRRRSLSSGRGRRAVHGVVARLRLRARGGGLTFAVIAAGQPAFTTCQVPPKLLMP